MILGIINGISILLCIYSLISKRYKTDDKRVTLLFICLNVVFMHRLGLVLDPTFILTLPYVLVNFVILSALLLAMSIFKKNVILDKTTLKVRLTKILNPIKARFIYILRYFKHNK